MQWLASPYYYYYYYIGSQLPLEKKHRKYPANTYLKIGRHKTKLKFQQPPNQVTGSRKSIAYITLTSVLKWPKKIRVAVTNAETNHSLNLSTIFRYMFVLAHICSSTRSRAACAMNWFKCLWSSFCECNKNTNHIRQKTSTRQTHGCHFPNRTNSPTFPGNFLESKT